MAVKSLVRSGVDNFEKYSSLLAGNIGYDTYFEHITTTTLGSAVASVTFSDLDELAGTYQHLQLRMVARSSSAGSGAVGARIRFNNGGNTDYSFHSLQGNGSSVSSYGDAGATYWYMSGVFPQASATTGVWGVAIADILDPFESKNKTIRQFTGVTGPTNKVFLESAGWFYTDGLSSFDIESDPSSGWVAGSRFSLYGLR